MKGALYIFAILGLFMSCKKDHTCECRNSNGTYEAGETKSTKNKAKKYCESLSGGDTQCYLK
jgi:hypothetical protein